MLGLPSGKELACQGRRYKIHRFNPWVRKIPWWRKWQPTSVFLPGESHGLSLEGYRGLSPQDGKELDTTATTEHIPGHTRLVLPHSKGGAVVVPELGIHWLFQIHQSEATSYMKKQLKSQLEGILWKCGILSSRNHKPLFAIESPVGRTDRGRNQGMEAEESPVSIFLNS